MGNTDGRVYSFTASSGDLAWTQSTGSYVYSGPAAAPVKGRGPTVFIGSYTGRFYAFDARSGAERWSFQSPGRISGAASVIGRVVYFANLATRETHGLDVRTGKEVFRHDGGGFSPPHLGWQDSVPDRLRHPARAQASEESSRGWAFGTSSS